MMSYIKPEIRLTHLPTGLVVYVRELGRHSAPTKRTHEAVRALLRAKLAKLREDPEWKENRGWYLGNRVRSWHLHTYLGVPTFVKNERTGRQWPYSPAMWMQGQIDDFLKDHVRSTSRTVNAEPRPALSRESRCITPPSPPAGP